MSMKKLSKEEIKKKIEHQREKQREYAKRQIERQKAKLQELKERPREKREIKQLTEEEKAKKIEKAKETQKRMRERQIERMKEKPKEFRKPIKKKARKKYKGIDVRSDFCIMPVDSRWEIKRREGLERHEVFNNASNRPKSIKDGLVIFLTPEQHRFGKYAIHRNKEFREYAQRIGMKVWCEYYKKTEDEFKARYGFYAR